jgi:hypothetical protein
MAYTYVQPPFALTSMDRGTFTTDAEAASVFCLAERRRKKKGLLGGTEERVVSLMKTNYPIYAIRWRDRSILLDGLGSVFEYVVYQDLVEVEPFLKDLEKASTEVGSLRAFLTKNDQTFREFKGSRRLKMNSIVSNVMLLSELTDYIKKSLPTKTVKETAVCFRVDKQTVAQIVSEFDTLVKQVEQDLMSFKRIEQSLRASIDKAKQLIKEDKEKDLERLNQDLDQLKPTVEAKVKEIQREQDLELENFLHSIELESVDIREEKAKCELDVKRLTSVQNECLEEKKASSQRDDRVGADFWNTQVETQKMRIADIWKTIKECSNHLEQIQFKSDATVKLLTDKYEKQKREVEDRLTDKEVSRDSEMAIKDIIMEELEHRYSLISDQINRLAEAKKSDLNRLNDMTTSWHPEEDQVVLVSLYLIGYGGERRERYDVYAPVVANSYTVFKKTFGRTFMGLDSKMTRLLTPIGREFAIFFEKGFLNILESNKKFEEAILTASRGTNLLESPHRGRIFQTGLESLKSEGWLTEDEYQKMLLSLNLSFKSVAKTGDASTDQIT